MVSWGKPNICGENLLKCHLVPHESHMKSHGIERDLPGERPVFIQLSYSAATG
jgi:hypothetical protein